MDLRQLHHVYVCFPGDPRAPGNRFRPQNVTELRTAAHRTRAFGRVEIFNQGLTPENGRRAARAGDRPPMPDAESFSFTKCAASSMCRLRASTHEGARDDR